MLLLNTFGGVSHVPLQSVKRKGVKMNQEIGKGALGEAGEYYIASQATMRGWTVNIQRHNHNGTDILLSDEKEGLKVCGLQVKTSRRASQWRMSKKDERFQYIFCPTLFYVLVLLDEGRTFHTAYILPAKFVAETIACGHKDYLARGGKDSDIRQLKASEIPNEYKEAWHLLE